MPVCLPRQRPIAAAITALQVRLMTSSTLAMGKPMPNFRPDGRPKPRRLASVSGIEQPVPSTILTSRPWNSQGLDWAWRCAPVQVTSSLNMVNGRRRRALQYPLVSSEQGRSPWVIRTAARCSTACWQEWSASAHCRRKRAKVTSGVKMVSAVEPTCRVTMPSNRLKLSRGRKVVNEEPLQEETRVLPSCMMAHRRPPCANSGL